jgi:hypothetical protein
MIPGCHWHWDLTVLAQAQGGHGSEREEGQQDRSSPGDRLVGPLALRLQPEVRAASSNCTSTDQRLMTHCRIYTGEVWRSVQKKASICSFPSGSQTSTKRMSTGGSPAVYHRAVRKKIHSYLR